MTLSQMRKEKVQRRLDQLKEMLSVQCASRDALVPYNVKPLKVLNKKYIDVRMNRIKRISKLERRIKSCKKTLSE
jgi:hypothetical protein